MNPVLTLTHDNLELTKRTVGSVGSQDCGARMFVVDNGSTDGTREWMEEAESLLIRDLLLWSFPDNRGVSAGWNQGLYEIFSWPDVSHVLVVGNDTVLPPWFYSELLSYDKPFVTGVAVDDMALIAQPPDQRYPLTENPDFSAFLIRRDCWEKVGPFEERMKLYASDCDFHVRAHRLGVPLYKACVPYYHERSSTLNNASPAEREAIQTQANEDRKVFREIYGCIPGESAYSDLFK